MLFLLRNLYKKTKFISVKLQEAKALKSSLLQHAAYSCFIGILKYNLYSYRNLIPTLR